MARLARALDEQLPADLTALPDVEVVIGTEFPPTVSTPDVIVVADALLTANPPRIMAADVLLALEMCQASPPTSKP